MINSADNTAILARTHPIRQVINPVDLSVIMHEACLLLFLYCYNRKRAILFKGATTGSFGQAE